MSSAPADQHLPQGSRAPQSHKTPARVAGELVYAIGDIHGRYDLLKDMLARIVTDAAGRADGRKPILVLCGDYIDRGPDSASVLTALDWIRRDERFALRALKGNHEQAFLAFLKDPQDGAGWLRFGGDATLRSYGVRPPEDFDDIDARIRARDDLLERMPASHLRVLQGLETMAVIGDYAFVHAGIRPGVALTKQRLDDLLWIRNGFLDHTRPFEKRIVHGHSWTEAEPEVYDNRIGLDTGAYETGVLTAVRIEDGEVTVLQSRGTTAGRPGEAFTDRAPGAESRSIFPSAKEPGQFRNQR
jgi:serine/threonine protein phosphatase 1